MSSMILSGKVNSRLNVRLIGYVLRRYLWTVTWGNGYIITMPLEVFIQRNSVADYIRLKLNFIQKENKKSLSELSFGGLRVNIHSPPITRWKAHGRSPIRHN